MKEAGCVHLCVYLSVLVMRICVSVHVFVSMLGRDSELMEPAVLDGHSCLCTCGFAQSRFMFRIHEMTMQRCSYIIHRSARMR